MTFDYSGHYEGRPVTGVVTDGVHDGDPHVVIRVEALVDGGVRVGLGPYTGTASLTDPRTAHATIAAVLDDAHFTGDPPQWGVLEPNAVA